MKLAEKLGMQNKETLDRRKLEAGEGAELAPKDEMVVHKIHPI